ncbi:MAG: phosphohydrolase [Candidatus Sericytochromatia bacterium]
MLNKAIKIAVEAHKEQLDKNNQSYLGHIFRVMNMGKTIDEKICGILHDLVEDTNWTFEKLEKEGFSEEIISALKCLTKTNEEEPYDNFINRVLSNKLAISVKINDLTDNLDIKRFEQLKETDLKRLNKYLKAYKKLTEFNNIV